MNPAAMKHHRNPTAMNALNPSGSTVWLVVMVDATDWDCIAFVGQKPGTNASIHCFQSVSSQATTGRKTKMPVTFVAAKPSARSCAKTLTRKALIGPASRPVARPETFPAQVG